MDHVQYQINSYLISISSKHYKAEWVDGSANWPLPRWPVNLFPNYLYGSYKANLKTAMKINGTFKSGSKIAIHVYQVSTLIDLEVKVDGKQAYFKKFIPGPGEGEWEQVIYRGDWDVYQNIYNKTYDFTLDTDARELSFAATNGDWMTFTELRITPPAGSGEDEIVLVPAITDWGVPQAKSYNLTPEGDLEAIDPPAEFAHLFAEDAYYLKPWQDIESNDIPVFIGEWGVYRFTPHDITLAFMEDRLKAMQKAGFGRALWNFRGSFGILDSDRMDVDYVNYNGHLLDEKMLQLLQKY